MENQKIDFEFGWWVSMTPALLVAVYFVSRWANNHTDTASLGIAVGSIMLGIVATSVLCHPNFNAREQEPSEPDTKVAKEAIPQTTNVPQDGAVKKKSRPTRTPVDCPTPTEPIPLPARFDTEPETTEVISASPNPTPTTPGVSFEELFRNTCEGLPALQVRDMSSDEIESAIAAIHAACCAEELERLFAPDHANDQEVRLEHLKLIDLPANTEQSCTNAAPKQQAVAMNAAPAPAKEMKPVDHAAMTSWFTKGMSLVQAGNFRDALYCFQFVLQQDAQHLPSLTTKAICLFQMKRYEEALKTFEQVRSIDASDIRAKEGIEATMKRMRAAAH